MKRWNLFARELEDILARRRLRLEQLGDRIAILPEKVRRLSQSLLKPKLFPVLNGDELDQVTQAYGLSPTEVARLQAAILASSIEKMLMERVSQDDALLAAEQLFPIILNALQLDNIDELGSMTRGDLFFAMDDESDMVLESALEAIDSATAALHLSRNVASHSERIHNAQQARQYFEQALAELKEVDDDIQAMQAWQDWYNEAQKGLKTSNERLEELGE